MTPSVRLASVNAGIRIPISKWSTYITSPYSSTLDHLTLSNLPEELRNQRELPLSAGREQAVACPCGEEVIFLSFPVILHLSIHLFSVHCDARRHMHGHSPFTPCLTAHQFQGEGCRSCHAAALEGLMAG